MKRVDATDVLDEVIRITVAAGREILSVYQQSYQIENKADGSPVTTAAVSYTHLTLPTKA